MPLLGLFGPPDIEKLEAQHDVKGLIKSLAYQKDRRKGHWLVRSQAAAALGRMGEAQAVEPLCTALEDIDWQVSQQAVTALGQIGDTRATEPLCAALQDKHWQVREQVPKALGQIGDARAVEPLCTALKDRLSSVGQQAAAALGRIGDTRAVEPLIATLLESDEAVRQAAVPALDKLGWKPDRDEASAAYWVAKGQYDVCIRLGAAAVRPLIAALNSGRGIFAAMQALGQIGDTRAVEPLSTALKHSNANMREAVVQALGHMGTAAVEPLTAALQDSEWRVRMVAAQALGPIGDMRAVQPLIAGLADRVGSTRRACALSLVSLYQRGQLDSESNEEILRARPSIVAQHTDGTEVCASSSVDNGIGIEFPL